MVPLRDPKLPPLPRAPCPQTHRVLPKPIDSIKFTPRLPNLHGIVTANTHAIRSTPAMASRFPYSRTKQVAGQAFNMDTIKKQLKDGLNNIGMSQAKLSSDLHELLSQWLVGWQHDSRDFVLLYVLGDRSGQYAGREPGFQNLDPIDQTKANILVEQCSKLDTCVHLAKMETVVDRNRPTEVQLTTTPRLLELLDHEGRPVADRPISFKFENIIQKDWFISQYCGTLTAQEPCATPNAESTISTSKTFQDWVSLSRVPPYCPLLMLASHHVYRYWSWFPMYLHSGPCFRMLGLRRSMITSK